MLLFCAGNLELLDTECVSLVGSRKLRTPGRQFARTLGQRAAEQGFTYVSGGAAGADTEGFCGAMGAGGRAVLFLADSLLGRMKRLRRELAAGRLLLISEQGCDLSFSAQRAHSRNRLIHAMGRKVFVAQSDYGSGGTWSGTVENLKSWLEPGLCLRGRTRGSGNQRPCVQRRLPCASGGVDGSPQTGAGPVEPVPRMNRMRQEDSYGKT